jgi:hypothetical protein
MSMFPPWLLLNSWTSVQSALGYQPRLPCQECSSWQWVPKAGQAPESSSRENCARSPQALKPKGCMRLPWCWWYSNFSNLCHLRPGPYRYFLRDGTSRVLYSMSPKPQSYGLGAASGHQRGEGLSVPQSDEIPWQPSRVAESLWDNPEFIKAGFHLGKFVTASVENEDDR